MLFCCKWLVLTHLMDLYHGPSHAKRIANLYQFHKDGEQNLGDMLYRLALIMMKTL